MYWTWCMYFYFVLYFLFVLFIHVICMYLCVWLNKLLLLLLHAQLKWVENVCNLFKAISSFQSAYKLYGIEMLKDWAFQKYIIFGVLLTPSGSYKKAFAKARVMPEARPNFSHFFYLLQSVFLNPTQPKFSLEGYLGL